MKPIVIEQDQAEADEAIALHGNTFLQDVRLVSSTLTCNIPFSETLGHLRTATTFATSESRLAQGKVILGVDFAFRAFQGDETKDAEKDLVIVRCRFEADYAVRPEYTPTPEQIAAFHKANAVFNAWPFFREYVQTSVTRMGLPAPPIPFLRLSLKCPEKPGQMQRRGQRLRRKPIVEKQS